MIVEASEYMFKPPSLISRARRILIKPSANLPYQYPISTSRDTLKMIIDNIKQVSDADIVILEGTTTGEPIYPIYKALEYDFSRVLLLDVRDCIWVEVENPLPHPFAVTTFWVPNVVISSDYLISVTPYKVAGREGMFSIKNLLSLLPINKYRVNGLQGWDALYELGIEKVFADLYFTLPFDLGIIDARQKYFCDYNQINIKVEEFGKVFAGEPYEIDREASLVGNLDTEYLDLIEAGKAELETWG